MGKTLILFVVAFALCCAATSNKFYHLADWHVDPYYLPTYNSSTHCHNATEFIPPLYPIPQSYFTHRMGTPWWESREVITPDLNLGQYGCDSPFLLVQQALQYMVQVLPNPDFIVYSGDMSAHHLPTPESRSISINDTIFALRAAFPEVPIIPSIGNNDCYPDYYLALPHRNQPNRWLENVYGIWSAYDAIPADQEDNFIYGGYFVAYYQNLAFLSLNTIYWCTGHDPSWDAQDQPDPAEQFAWMSDTLAAAKQNNQQVYIVGHIPPGGGWQSLYTDTYYNITIEYADIIVAQLYGHTHRDQFHLMTESSDKAPFGFVMQTPALTPKSDNNPSFRIVDYDPTSYLMMDYTEYYSDLLQAQRLGYTVWRKEYQFSVLYNVTTGITPQTIQQTVEYIKNDPMVYTMWKANYVTQYADPDDLTSDLCEMYYVRESSVAACTQAGPYQVTQDII